MSTDISETTPAGDLLSLRYVPLDQAKRWERNPKKHDEEGIRDSIVRFGFKDPPKYEPMLNGGKGGLGEGNGRAHVLAAMKDAGDAAPRGIAVEGDVWLMPIFFGVDAASEREAEAYGVTHNNLTMAGGDFELLDFQRMWEGTEYLELLSGLAEAGELPVGMTDEAFDSIVASLEEDKAAASKPKVTEDEARQTLVQRFGVPPFSILDARQGYWQDRKNAWLALGLRSFEGRNDSLVYQQSSKPPEFYKIRNEMRAKTGVDPSWDEIIAEAERLGKMTPGRSGTSIFDPVLCELAYRWFCPPEGVVLDPFAGGSVRGLIAAKLGRSYYGVDLRPEQVEANETAWPEFAKSAEIGDAPRPSWIVGDSCDLPTMEGIPAACDFVFSCPPYADLEKYSDDDRDLSNMEYFAFREAYERIIEASVARLKDDRFACFVVGEVRDKKGFNRGFVADTIRAFEEAGAHFYNDIVLVTQVNSGAIRAARMFEAGRKVCKTHQNVLVFVKGDPKRATQAVGPCEFGEVVVPEEDGAEA